MIWYSSDLHYNHKLVAKKRGFTEPPARCAEPDHFDPCSLCAPGDPEAHDATVLQNWNRLVRPGDRAYILGDFAMNWTGVDKLLAQMNGEIILVCGNHDIMSAVHRDGWKHREHWTGEGGFAAIMDLARRKVAGYDFLMSHYPYAGDHTGEDRYLQYRLRDYGMWLLHGHTHGRSRLGTDISYSRMTGKTYQDGEDRSAGWMAHARQIHVGADAWDLCPVSETQVLALMDEEGARVRGFDKRWVYSV